MVSFGNTGGKHQIVQDEAIPSVLFDNMLYHSIRARQTQFWFVGSKAAVTLLQMRFMVS